MSLLHVRDLSLHYGPKVLLDGASFVLGHRDRAGLIGPNGSGKSTLMKILAGRVEPDAGSVQLVRRARAGYLPQELSELPPGSVIDGVLSSVPGRTWLESRIAAAEAALPKAVTEEEQIELGGELAELHEELVHHDERYGRHRAEEILTGLGFAPQALGRDARELSGGWRMRAALAALLLQDPELLLLDEPTNHLDVPTLEWFDGFLRRSRKALVLVTHDREFLDRQVDRVLSFEPEGLRSYAGNYERYLELRAAEEEQLQAQAEKQQRRRAQMQAFIDRFRSPEAPRSGREVARFDDVSKSYGSKTLYRNLNGQILRGDRIAVIGLNGAGKTTLLKLLAGELKPDEGSVRLGPNVVPGYFAQHHAELQGPERTVLQEVAGLVPREPRSWVRSVLGSFLFSGDEVDKRIAVLSGGERARVALARLLVVPSNFLLMDEPTNHLDLDSSEALIEALTGYEGTLLFVSHNRSFVNGLATHVWEVKDLGLDAQPGDLDDWQRRRAESAQAAPPAPQPEHAGGQGKDARRERALQREKRLRALGPLLEEIGRIEERIARLEQEKKDAEAQLADPGVFADPARSTSAVTAYRDAQRDLEELYRRWEERQEELQRAEARLDQG